jgi:DNA-binding response OmpR family regulator
MVRKTHCECCGQPLPSSNAYGIVIDSPNRTVLFEGKSTYLTGSCLIILKLLLARIGNFVPYDTVFNELYGLRPNDFPQMATVKVIVHKLRQKIRPLGLVIETRYGMGYILRIPDQPKESQNAPHTDQLPLAGNSL